MKYTISTTSSDNPKNAIKLINKTDANYLHVDVMDAKFVKNKQYGVSDIKKFDELSTKPLDIHLMVTNPLKYLEKIAFLNIAYLTFHLEAVKDVDQVINAIKMTGIRAGLSIKPNTDLKQLTPYLDKIDLILLMSVEPGEGGQPFLEETTNRLTELKKITKDKNVIISVDGGINAETIIEVKDADMVVIGSYLTNSDNYQEAINHLKDTLASSNTID